MGLLTILKKMKIKEKEMRLLMLYPLWLDNAGKTTTLKRFNGEEIDTISPTLGFNIKTLEHIGYTLNVWDVGGQKSLRSYWRNYYECTDGLVWVRLSGASLLVLANKQDLPGALSAEEIKEVLELDRIKTHHWHIVRCSAVTGENLLEAMNWLVGDIAARIFTLD
ncbi:hypothetical protein J437_LFUL000125 [Ladona fulva]|uniref:ADP-ribosylation factor-like protein 2 n=1 Tax=Ladona fulva TaxID=123851 RepID=A0A8K0P0G5_LADFU|nr:hypothetical protein J437_LFUL000125 [Ladona fulva]